MKKNAQAAMEFLMTYGWAILVVLAAIAALAYFGVLSPDRFLPNKCQMESGVGCVDFVATSQTRNITLILQNGAGFDILVNNITVDGCGDPQQGDISDAADGSSLTASRWINGKKVRANFNCSASDLVSGTKFQGQITLNYNTTNGLRKTMTGDLVVKAE